jgi:hypothetical protein
MRVLEDCVDVGTELVVEPGAVIKLAAMTAPVGPRTGRVERTISKE